MSPQLDLASLNNSEEMYWSLSSSSYTPRQEESTPLPYTAGDAVWVGFQNIPEHHGNSSLGYTWSDKPDVLPHRCLVLSIFPSTVRVRLLFDSHTLIEPIVLQSCVDEDKTIAVVPLEWVSLEKPDRVVRHPTKAAPPPRKKGRPPNIPVKSQEELERRIIDYVKQDMTAREIGAVVKLPPAKVVDIVLQYNQKNTTDFFPKSERIDGSPTRSGNRPNR